MSMEPPRLENSYYGKRQVVYVCVRTPDNGKCRSFSVYGNDWKAVVKAVAAGLENAFGRGGSKRRKSRRSRKPSRSRRADKA